jgi:hypothetical protein
MSLQLCKNTLNLNAASGQGGKGRLEAPDILVKSPALDGSLCL